MKEKINTIPIQDAFAKDCECPACAMYQKLEENAIHYTIGPGARYMEEDIRAQTDWEGFFQKHFRDLYAYPNKMGLALMLKTHMDKTIKELEEAMEEAPLPSSNSMFRKAKPVISPVAAYVERLERECFVCGYIRQTFESYLRTIFYLYEREEEFRQQFARSKGFCTSHYKELFCLAPKYLKKQRLEQFLRELNQAYLENFKRVRDDVEWFICKNDYRYQDEPWKNARDALQRALTKTGSMILPEEEP